MSISVVISTHPGREASTASAVASVLEQTLQPSCIVVERDTTRAGAAATKNAGLARVDTEWVAFLDSDDLFLPHHLATLRAAAERGADVAYALPRVVGPSGQVIPRRFEWGGGPVFDPVALQRASYIGTPVLVRAELARRVGGFQCPAGSVYDDWGLVVALLRVGARFQHVHQETWLWRHHGRNSSGVPGRGDAPGRGEGQ